MQLHISKSHIRWLILLVLVIGLVYSYFVDTRGMDFAPKCMFYQLTGFKCPGCGTQRALHELAHFNFAGVFQYNPFLVFALPYLVLLFYLYFWGGDKRFPKVNAFVNSKPAILFVFFLIVAYWIIRNIIGV